MLKIAIVGNIASGKTTVENIIKGNGFKVFDTDEIAHEILGKSKKINKIFGTLDRKKIAEIVFRDKTKLQLLEKNIHPQVKNELKKIFSSDYKIVFVSVPQLFEAGFENLFDKIVFITADKDIRLKRLIKRNSLSTEEALLRIEAQADETGKIAKSDFIIENNSDKKELEQQIKKLLSILIR